MKKLLLVLPGYCVGLGGLLLITYRTLRAIGSESKTITVQVNMFGEQYLDVVSLVFLWVVCLVGLLSLWLLVTEKTRIPRVSDLSSSGTVQENPDELIHRTEETHSSVSVKEQVVCADSFGVLLEQLLLDDDGSGGAFSVSVPFSQDEQ
jgi:hypothetical protein